MENETMSSFDAAMRDKTMQAEFDRRVGKALDTARAKWEQEALERDGLVARRAAEEAMKQAEKDFSIREEEMKRRERDIGKRELRGAAMELLSKRELPSELAEFVSMEDIESMQRSVERIEGVFLSCVRKGMLERMRGLEPEKGEVPPKAEDMDDESYYRTRFARNEGGI